MPENINSASVGLNFDATSNQLKVGELTNALNAMIENFDGQQITYQNEQANTGCIQFPVGYIIIGVKNIAQNKKVIYFLTNPTIGFSQIGYSDNEQCVYNILIDDSICEDKLNFSIDYPIHEIEVKNTDCSTQFYWTDNYNPRRYIDLDDMPWREEEDPYNSFKNIKIVGQLDSNKLLVQPNFSVPIIENIKETIGGILKAGTYQFFIQYSNALGDGYTSYYGDTNPVSIYSSEVVSPNFDYPTAKAIEIDITNLDTTGLYDYFNLAVIETVNLISTPKLLGTFPIVNSTFQHTYTGNEQSQANIQLTITDIIEQFPYYDLAKGLTQVDNVLVWHSLKQLDNVSYQQIWNKVKTYWESYKIPYNKFEGYYNGINTSNFRGYPRDEIIALEGRFILKNGRRTAACHIPGRSINTIEGQFIDGSDKDVAGIRQDPCENPTAKHKWQVYNTASLIDYSPEYKTKTVGDDCYVGPYQYGEMGYWQSIELYPNNSLIWKELANQPIRHHKLPDCIISPIHDNNTSGNQDFQHSIFPLGVKIDASSLYQAIKDSDLTQAQKDQIVGFEILRGNRVNNKSIIAKGLLTNVGKYTYKEDTYYYPNYPYNDLRTDPFFTSEKLPDHTGFRPDKSLNGFGEHSKSRFIFHSPNTHFYQPTLSEGQQLKLETIEYGESYGHFVQVKRNAEYKFLTRNTLYAAAGIAIGSGFTIGAGTFGSPTFSGANVIPTFTAANDLFEKLSPFTNFGYSFNSIGLYNKSFPIPNSGNKIRNISYSKYIIDGLNSVESGSTINNFRRESSIYIHTDEDLLFPTDYSSSIPEDNSRYTAYQSTNNFISLNDFYALCLLDSTNTLLVKSAVENGLYLNGSNYDPGSNVSDLLIVYNLWDTLKNAYSNSTDAIYQINQYGIDDGTHSIPEQALSYAFYRSYQIYLSDVNIDPINIRKANISAYYGSIKRTVDNLWGRMYSYETIPTGYIHPLLDTNGQQFTSFPTVFGGDTFINRFALKTKVPFFVQNTVNQPNSADIQYDMLANYGYPMFWLSTKPARFSIDITREVNAVGQSLGSPTVGQVLIGLISGGTGNLQPVMTLLIKLFKEIYTKIGIKNVNFDNASVEGLTEQGLMYLFCYGVPYYFCESEVNVDMRQATNDLSGNYFPNVTENIPDDWVQEVNVPIINDNSYNYNQTYSKQNKETFSYHLAENWDPEKLCTTTFYNRAIWSDKSNVEETKNNWLIYRPAARFDFPKSYGDLTSLNTLENKEVLARFVNKSQIYNAFTTVDVSKGPTAYLGNSQLFSGLPLDLTETDGGWGGSQHKFLLRTEYGHIYVDSKRGQIILLQGEKTIDIADIAMGKWFTKNLDFTISQYFPEVDIDNNFKGIGIHGVYDQFFDRFILTKLDYQPISSDIKYDGNFYILLNSGEKQYISLQDEKYFNNLSFTVSFSFKLNRWISFHSYLPNYYIPFSNFFQSGNNSLSSLWNHNKTYTQYNNYYNTRYPYILEYPFVYKKEDEILQSVKDYTSARKYSSFYIYTEPDEILYFNKALIYNEQQCSGILNLIPKQNNNLSQRFSYPKYNTSSKDILLSKSDGFYQFNDFWDIIKDTNSPIFSQCVPNLSCLNNTNMDYTQRNYKKGTIRGKTCRIRLILDDKSDVRLITRFIIQDTQTSYK